MASGRRASARPQRLPHVLPGQAIVEFALVVPVLLFILLAIIQLGIMLATKNAVTFAVNQGVRVAAIHGAEVNANDQICAAINQGLRSEGANPAKLGTVYIFDGNPSKGLNAAATNNPTYNDTGTCSITDTWHYTGNANYPYYNRDVVAPADPIGVSLTYTFTFLLPVFGASLTLGGSGIQQIEPQFASNVAAGTGPTPVPDPYTQTPLPTNTPLPTLTQLPTFTPSNTPTTTPTPTPSPTTTGTTTSTPTATTTSTATVTPTPTAAALCQITLAVAGTPANRGTYLYPPTPITAVTGDISSTVSFSASGGLMTVSLGIWPLPSGPAQATQSSSTAGSSSVTSTYSSAPAGSYQVQGIVSGPVGGSIILTSNWIMTYHASSCG